MQDVAEHKLLWSEPILVIGDHPRLFVWNQHQVTECAVMAFGNVVKTGNLHVCRRTANAAIEAIFEVALEAGAEDCGAVLERCADQGVLLTPGRSCGDDYARWVRLCFTSVPPARLEAALEKLAPLFRRPS